MQGSSSESGVAFYVKHKTDGDIFYVKNDGSLKATKAEITGKVTAKSGTIGGFDIKDPYMITSGKDSIGVDGCLYFNPNGSKSTASVGGSNSISGWVIAAGKNFGVTSSGKIYATSGLIGGFDIGSSYMITSGKGSIGVDGCLYFNPTGSNSKASVGGSDSISGWMIAAGKNFGVTNDGTLYANASRFCGGVICWDSNHQNRIGMNNGTLAFGWANEDATALYIRGSIGPIGTTYADNGIYIQSKAGTGVEIKLTNQIMFFISGVNVLNIYKASNGSICFDRF